MKSSPDKTRQSSLLILKPLQMKNLKGTRWGTWHIISTPSEKVGVHGGRDPHLSASMSASTLT